MSPDPDSARRGQSNASKQGKLFEEQCRLLLVGVGFTAAEKNLVIPEVGIEVDIDATNRRGVQWFFECKGSWLGTRPGGRRTDTVKKALLSAYALHCHAETWPRLVLLTSHLPKDASRGDAMVRTALECGALADLICVNDPADMARLHLLAEAPG